MKSRRLEVVALALAAQLICCPAWSIEPSFEVTGSYNTVTDAAITAGLTLNDDGSAQYVVRWLAGEDSNSLGKFSAYGRWTRQGSTLTLLFPNQGGTAKVVYEVSSCLSYKTSGSSSCSPGLHVVTSDLPGKQTWELWKTELLKL